MITVPGYQDPLMVTFADIADPTSVTLVDPANLAASFGPGVRLRSVVLEVTDEPVTEGVTEGGWWGIWKPLEEGIPSRFHFHLDTYST